MSGISRSLSAAAIIILLTTSIAVATQAPTPTVTPVPPPELRATPGTGCTSSTPEDEKVCSWPSFWWTSWSSCDITPVSTTLWPRPDLATIPWIRVDIGPVKADAHLFFGNRPLPVGRQFPHDGPYTKVLWTFSERVSGFSGAATNLDNPQYTDIPFLETGPANTSSDRSTEWPSYVTVPTAGCWKFDLRATRTSGEVVTGTFTYVAVP